MSTLLPEHKDMRSTEMMQHQQNFTPMMTVKKLPCPIWYPEVL